MNNNYSKIVKNNLERLYSNLSANLHFYLPAEKKGNSFSFDAFGGPCRIQPDGIFLNDKKEDGVLGILISLYALNASDKDMIIEPFRAFKDFPNSSPYIGAFSTHSEHILVPHVKKIEKAASNIKDFFKSQTKYQAERGDFSFVLYPLPKIALFYIFYHADEEFPATATCLFSNNADGFLPLDALADVGEYTSKKIITLLK